MSSDAPRTASPAFDAFAVRTLDDIATLLVQAEPEDTRELTRVRAALIAFAGEAGSGPVCDALFTASRAVQSLLAGTAADPQVALRQANASLELAMRQSAPGAAEIVTPAAVAPQPVAPPTPVAAPAPVAAAAPAAPAAPLTLPADVDIELLREFLNESRDCLGAAEASLLALESDPEDDEAINTVFRAFHTIKGTSAFMGLTSMSEFAHHAESLLSRVRDRDVSFGGECAELSLRSLDMLVELMDSVDGALDGGTLDVPDGYADLLHDLEGIDVRIGDGSYAAASAAGAAVQRGAPSAEEHDWLEAPGDGSDTADGVDCEAPSAERRTAVGPGDRRQGDRRQAERRNDADASIRVRLDRLDQLIDMVGELVIAQSMLAQDPIVHGGQNHVLQGKVTHAGKIVRDLQDLSMSMRMVPLKAMFQKLNRLVRDLAIRNGKQVEFVTEGEDTEIDRNMVDVVSDPLIHMVRNALDHGIEPPHERELAGKPRTGTVRLAAYHSGGNVIVDLQDDGRGLDRDRILKKAIDKGLVASDKGMSDSDVLNLIFAPGFSTAERITDISGRGVGMDVVKRNVESLRGRVDINSELGKGTTFGVRLPLTLAVTDGMLVRVGDERYIVPLINIHMSFRPEASMLSTVAGSGEMVLLRDELMPIVRVHRLFNVQNSVENVTDALLMIVGDGDRRTALLVDDLLGQHQVVAKAIGEGIGPVPGISGAAILGDGRAGLILDVPSILALARQGGRATRGAA